MTTTSTLIEASFAKAVEAIEAAAELPAYRRQHWVCSLRQIARAMDKPLELIPARWTSARFAITRLHHVPAGWTAKTLANHKANARAALLWFGKEQNIPSRGAPLTPEWQLLRSKVTDLRCKSNLSALMRYCSAQGLGPQSVSDMTIDAFMGYRAATTALATDDAARRSLARAWNRCGETIAEWPAKRLIEPPTASTVALPWEQFPAGLREEIERYLTGLGAARRSRTGKRLRPCKSTTVRTRRAELMAVARMAVRTGTPIEKLTSLGTLLDPDLVEKVLDTYWQKDGEEPGSFTIDLGWKLLAVARETGCVDDLGLERLDDMRASLEHHRRGGMTEKNLQLVRQVLTDGVWERIVNLPADLMATAHSSHHAPVKAAITAQLAVAIAILTFAPVRLGNLVSIRLDENLIKPGGLESPYWLVFPGYDVKNQVTLEFPFDVTLTRLIDIYVHEFRPALLRGSNEKWLFPGEDGGFKTSNMFSGQITERIERATGLRITAHQFRHAAGAMVLKHHPGNYELVRRLLGHRNVQTTTRSYLGLETTQASEIFGRIIRDQVVLEEA